MKDDVLSPRLRGALMLILVATCGFFAGILADRLLLARVAHAAEAPDTTSPAPVRVIRGPDSDPAARGLRVFRLGLPEQLAAELDLSPDQRAQIERILAEDQEALRELLEQLEPRMVAVVERSRERIFQILTEEQAARWRESQVLRLRAREP